MLVTIVSPCKITAFYCLYWEWFCLWSLRCGKERWSNCTPVSCKLCSNFVFLKALWKPTTRYNTSRLFSHRYCCSMTSAEDPFPCSLGVPAFKLHTCEQSTGGNRVHFKVEGLAQLNKPCVVQVFVKLMGRKRLKIWDLILLSWVVGCSQIGSGLFSWCLLFCVLLSFDRSLFTSAYNSSYPWTQNIAYKISFTFLYLDNI